MDILITGGAGFVGGNLGVQFKRANPNNRVVAFDNLKRRGSELNLKRLRQCGIEFVHGDVRNPEDLDSIQGNFDLLVEASAEPSVSAGLNGSPRYLLNTNLLGTINCAEFSRGRVGGVIFLSTSRVYSIEPLKKINLVEEGKRFSAQTAQLEPGVSPRGIAEHFPTQWPRSLYGASKLASELLLQEYCYNYKLPVVINRCGVIAGPGQFGKVDQGVFTLWVAAHVFGKPLAYFGFGGTGRQVRDLLHPTDLYEAIRSQVENFKALNGETFNLGGGTAGAVSLSEYTGLCVEVTNRKVPIESRASTIEVDIPWYVTDFAKAERAFGFCPSRSPAQIVAEIYDWMQADRDLLKPIFFPE